MMHAFHTVLDAVRGLPTLIRLRSFSLLKSRGANRRSDPKTEQQNMIHYLQVSITFYQINEMAGQKWLLV